MIYSVNDYLISYKYLVFFCFLLRRGVCVRNKHFTEDKKILISIRRAIIFKLTFIILSGKCHIT
jgi:hypothetical protein